MDRDVEQLLRAVYAAFNARDIDAVLAVTTEDVDWPNVAGNTRAIGHEAVRDYWTRQWSEIDPYVYPQRFRELDDGRIAVDVHRVVKGMDGAVLVEGEVEHVYTMRDGLVARMDASG